MKESLSVAWVGSILHRAEFLYIWASMDGRIRQFLRRSVLIYVIEWVEFVFLALLLKVCALYMIRMDELLTSAVRKTLDYSESDTCTQIYLHPGKYHLEPALDARPLQLARVGAHCGDRRRGMRQCRTFERGQTA